MAAAARARNAAAAQAEALARAQAREAERQDKIARHARAAGGSSHAGAVATGAVGAPLARDTLTPLAGAERASQEKVSALTAAPATDLAAIAPADDAFSRALVNKVEQLEALVIVQQQQLKLHAQVVSELKGRLDNARRRTPYGATSVYGGSSSSSASAPPRGARYPVQRAPRNAHGANGAAPRGQGQGLGDAGRAAPDEARERRLQALVDRLYQRNAGHKTVSSVGTGAPEPAGQTRGPLRGAATQAGHRRIGAGATQAQGQHNPGRTTRAASTVRRPAPPPARPTESATTTTTTKPEDKRAEDGGKKAVVIVEPSAGPKSARALSKPRSPSPSPPPRTSAREPVKPAAAAPAPASARTSKSPAPTTARKDNDKKPESESKISGAETGAKPDARHSAPPKQREPSSSPRKPAPAATATPATAPAASKSESPVPSPRATAPSSPAKCPAKSPAKPAATNAAAVSTAKSPVKPAKTETKSTESKTTESKSTADAGSLLLAQSALTKAAAAEDLRARSQASAVAAASGGGSGSDDDYGDDFENDFDAAAAVLADEPVDSSDVKKSVQSDFKPAAATEVADDVDDMFEAVDALNGPSAPVAPQPPKPLEEEAVTSTRTLRDGDSAGTGKKSPEPESLSAASVATVTVLASARALPRLAAGSTASTGDGIADEVPDPVILLVAVPRAQAATLRPNAPALRVPGAVLLAATEPQRSTVNPDFASPLLVDIPVAAVVAGAAAAVGDVVVRVEVHHAPGRAGPLSPAAATALGADSLLCSGVCQPAQVGALAVRGHAAPVAVALAPGPRADSRGSAVTEPAQVLLWAPSSRQLFTPPPAEAPKPAAAAVSPVIAANTSFVAASPASGTSAFAGSHAVIPTASSTAAFDDDFEFDDAHVNTVPNDNTALVSPKPMAAPVPASPPAPAAVFGAAPSLAPATPARPPAAVPVATATPAQSAAPTASLALPASPATQPSAAPVAASAAMSDPFDLDDELSMFAAQPAGSAANNAPAVSQPAVVAPATPSKAPESPAKSPVKPAAAPAPAFTPAPVAAPVAAVPAPVPATTTTPAKKPAPKASFLDHDDDMLNYTPMPAAATVPGPAPVAATPAVAANPAPAPAPVPVPVASSSVSSSSWLNDEPVVKPAVAVAAPLPAPAPVPTYAAASPVAPSATMTTAGGKSKPSMLAGLMKPKPADAAAAPAPAALATSVAAQAQPMPAAVPAPVSAPMFAPAPVAASAAAPAPAPAAAPAKKADDDYDFDFDL